MNTKSKKIVALILAAGESKRLGQPKQNVMFKNRTMLNHIKEHLNLDIVERTFIVLGAYADKIISKSGLNESHYLVFDGWKEGMGSSLAYACSKIFALDDYDGILITLSDLPLVTSSDYRKMIEMFNSSKHIVATQTKKTLGVPAIFGADYFDHLIQLTGEKGAKSIIQSNIDMLKIIENEKAAIDIDTPDEFSKLTKQ